MPEFTFEDDAGDTWVIRPSTVFLMSIEQRLDAKFSRVDDSDGALLRMLGDPMFAFRCIALAVEGQLGERGLSLEEFSDRLVGDTLGRAQTALVDAVVAWFPDPARRKAAQEAVAAFRQAENALTSRAMQELKSLDVDKLAEAILSGGDDGST